MGKKLVIKGADFSENALYKTFSYNQLIADKNADGNYVNVTIDEVGSFSGSQGLYMNNAKRIAHLKEHAITDFIAIPTTAKTFRLQTHTLPKATMSSGTACLYLVFYSSANLNDGIGCYACRPDSSTTVPYNLLGELEGNSEINITGSIPTNAAYIRCAYKANSNKKFLLELFEEE